MSQDDINFLAKQIALAVRDSRGTFLTTYTVDVIEEQVKRHLIGFQVVHEKDFQELKVVLHAKNRILDALERKHENSNHR